MKTKLVFPSLSLLIFANIAHSALGTLEVTSEQATFTLIHDAVITIDEEVYAEYSSVANNIYFAFSGAGGDSYGFNIMSGIGNGPSLPAIEFPPFGFPADQHQMPFIGMKIGDLGDFAETEFNNHFSLVFWASSRKIVDSELFFPAGTQWSVFRDLTSYNFNTTYDFGELVVQTYGIDDFHTVGAITAIPEPTTYATIAGLFILALTIIHRGSNRR